MKLSDEELEKMKGFVNSMSDEEKRFSFLSSAFIFKKIENSSDKLYKKLIDLMEKKAKTIKDTIKSVTQEESNEIILQKKSEVDNKINNDI